MPHSRIRRFTSRVRRASRPVEADDADRLLESRGHLLPAWAIDDPYLGEHDLLDWLREGGDLVEARTERKDGEEWETNGTYWKREAGKTRRMSREEKEAYLAKTGRAAPQQKPAGKERARPSTPKAKKVKPTQAEAIKVLRDFRAGGGSLDSEQAQAAADAIGKLGAKQVRELATRLGRTVKARDTATLAWQLLKASLSGDELRDLDELQPAAPEPASPSQPEPAAPTPTPTAGGNDEPPPVTAAQFDDAVRAVRERAAGSEPYSMSQAVADLSRFRTLPLQDLHRVMAGMGFHMRPKSPDHAIQMIAERLMLGGAGGGPSHTGVGVGGTMTQQQIDRVVSGEAPEPAPGPKPSARSWYSDSEPQGEEGEQAAGRQAKQLRDAQKLHGTSVGKEFLWAGAKELVDAGLLAVKDAGPFGLFGSRLVLTDEAERRLREPQPETPAEPEQEPAPEQPAGPRDEQAEHDEQVAQYREAVRTHRKWADLGQRASGRNNEPVGKGGLDAEARYLVDHGLLKVERSGPLGLGGGRLVLTDAAASARRAQPPIPPLSPAERKAAEAAGDRSPFMSDEELNRLVGSQGFGHATRAAKQAEAELERRAAAYRALSDEPVWEADGGGESSPRDALLLALLALRAKVPDDGRYAELSRRVAQSAEAMEADHLIESHGHLLPAWALDDPRLSDRDLLDWLREGD